MDRFTDRTVVITGGGSGIGKATAVRVAAEGAKVVIVDMNPDAGSAVAEEVGGIAVQADVTDAADVARMFQTAFDTYRGDKMNHEPLTLIRRARGKSWLRIDGFANPDDLAREYARVSTE